MSDPREVWKQLSQQVQNAQRQSGCAEQFQKSSSNIYQSIKADTNAVRFGGGSGGGAPSPRKALGGAALLGLGLGGVWLVNNALFNGTAYHVLRE